MFLMAFLVFGMIGLVSAEETDSGIEIQKPGSINGFERVMENFRLSLISNPEKKAERALEFAEERLAEIEKLTEEGDFERAEKLREHYEKMIQRSEEAMGKMEFNGDLKKSENALRAMARMQNDIEGHEEKINEIHTRILENNENMTDEELENLEELFEVLSERGEEIAEKAAEKRENFETKHKVLSEMTDEELLEFLEQIESEEGLFEEREMRLEREKVRNTREINAREMNLERTQERIENSNMTDEEKEMALERFEMQQENFEEFRERKEQGKNFTQERREEAKELREEHQEDMIEAIEEELENRQNSEENETEDEEESEEENETEESLA